MSVLALVVVLIAVSSVDSLFKKSFLRSRKLCNNDPGDVLHLTCYNAHFTEKEVCDKRAITQAECSLLRAVVSNVSSDTIAEMASFVDADLSIRRVSIEVDSRPTVSALTSWSEAMDDFLTPRPVWSLTSEPFNSSDKLVYTFERFSQRWEAYFRHSAALNYPNQTACSELPMVVGRSAFVHPGYSDVRREYFEMMHDTPAVFGIQMSNLDEVAEKKMSVIASDEDCPPSRGNRWTCAFLPTTNCTIPSAAMAPDEQHTSLYSSATSAGKELAKDFQLHEKLQEIATQRMHDIKSAGEIVHGKLPHFVYLRPHANFTNMHLHHGPNPNQVADFLFFTSLFRKNAFYRRRVAENLASFRAKYGFGDSIRTESRRFVAVQLRRGDRTMKQTNVYEVCRNVYVWKTTHVRQKCKVNGEEQDCEHVNPDIIGCPDLDDVPFSALTLAFAVQHAELLVDPSIRNMIVFSDDSAWVESEVAALQRSGSSWKFFTLDPPPAVVPSYFNTLNEDQKRDTLSYGTHKGVHFHASLALVQECDALLGHFSSGVPMTLAGVMCVHHAGMEGICPPVYNLAWGKHDN